MSWNEYGIEDVCELIVDCVNRTAPIVDYETPYKMIRTSNVRDGWINLSDARNVTKDTFEKWTRRAVPRQGDVVLTREAPLGEVGIIRTDEPIFLGQRTVMYRANPDKILPHFLYYSLLSHDVQAQIKAFGFGSTVSHMRVPDAKKLQMKVPDMVTQEKIICVMNSYDSMIEANQRRIQLLEESARLLYREWFVKLRFPGHETVAVVAGLPEGWKRINLLNFADVTYGFPFRADLFNSEKIGTPIVRIRDIQGVSTDTYTSEEADPQYLISRGDFLVGMDGNFHMNHWAGEPGYLVQRVCRIMPRDRRFLGFLGLAMHGPVKHYEATISGATVAHLGAKHLKQIELLVPANLQDQIDVLNNLMWEQVTLREHNVRGCPR